MPRREAVNIIIIIIILLLLLLGGSLFLVVLLFLWPVVFSEELFKANSWGVFQVGTAHATADAAAAGGCGGSLFVIFLLFL